MRRADAIACFSRPNADTRADLDLPEEDLPALAFAKVVDNHVDDVLALNGWRDVARRGQGRVGVAQAVDDLRWEGIMSDQPAPARTRTVCNEVHKAAGDRAAGAEFSAT